MSAASAENKGIGERLWDSVGDLCQKVTSFPDTLPDCLQGVIEEKTWQKVARVGFDILLIGISAIAIYFIASPNPNIPSFMMTGAAVVLGGFGIKYLIQDLLGKEYARTAAKVMAVLMPLLLLGGTACMVGAGLHSWMGGNGFNLYFLAGIVMIPLTVVAMKHSASAFQGSNATFVERRAQPRPLPQPNTENPFDAIRPPD